MTHSSKHHDTAAERPFLLRRRPDLTIVPQDYGRQRYWLVKDPVSLNYFHLREEEYAILEMLDGRTGFTEIKARFEKRFAPFRLPFEQIQAFLGRLHQCGLILSDAPGQGEQLLERAAAGRKQRWLAAWANVLAIRFRGTDPQPLLDWLAGHHVFMVGCRWCFSRAFLLLVLLLALAAVAVGGTRYAGSLQAPMLPAMWAAGAVRSMGGEFFYPGNLVWLAVVLAAAKVLHELGHALSCLHFGGQCRELGLMLLVFTPCLYCDVSDAWTFPDKWRRITVSAAGIVVEIFLASVATLLWCYTRPGLVHALSLNVMVVCSVSTLLFNGNPLLRYDGYYVLADLLEVPNLAEQSRLVVVRTAAFLFLGIRQMSNRMLPARGRWLLGLYGLASLAYRFFITLAILWFVHRITKSYGMEVLGNALAVVVLGGMVLLPAWRFAAFLGSRGTRWGTQYTGSGSWRRGRRWGTQYPGSRAIVLCGLWAGGLVFFALLPWPCRVAAPMVVEPENAHRVYAVVAGTMISSVRAGERVEKGQEVARLVNLDIRKEIVELTGKRNQQRRQLAILRLRQAQDRSVAGLIPTAETALADLEERLRQRQRDEESLVLRAPLEGTVLPPGHHVPMVDSVGPPPASAQLGTWTGTPLDERNRGCQVETGTLVCMIGSAQPVEAFTVIDQDAVALVREGQPVRLRIDALPGEVFEGRVVEIATSDLKVVPRELAAGADLAVCVDPRGIARPASISYQVRVRFDRQPGVSLLGSRGQAKILVDPQSLVERLYRAFRQTFELRW